MRRVRQREFHEVAMLVWNALPAKERDKVAIKSVERYLRKDARRSKLRTNGRTKAARPWPAKAHAFDRCADCLAARSAA